MAERTLVFVKPDGVHRGLVGEVISRFERKGLQITELSVRTLDPEFADRHYAEHIGKTWYPQLREFITSGPIVAMIVEGEQVVEVVRAMVGATDARTAAPGTIRGDLANSNRLNLVHASDSPESAQREIDLFFPGS
ncbi:MAG: nucleoside-diphosphate kinase [Actinomycetes bacterium]